MTTSLDLDISHFDPEVHAIASELERQRNTLEMFASENFAPVAVMQAPGSVLTNKYAEGYPGRRSRVENLAGTYPLYPHLGPVLSATGASA